MSAIPKRRKAVRRAEILAAATEVFLEKPFEGASVAEIAARADCVEGTIYTYFRSKRDLFDAVLTAFYDRLIADIEPRFASIDDTGDRLRFLIARHLQIAIDDPAMAPVLAREASARSDYFGSRLHGLNRRYTQFMMMTLRDGVARGELRSDLDLQMARDFVFGGLEHAIRSRLGRERRFDAPRIAREMASMLLQGWAAPAPSAIRSSVLTAQDFGDLEQRVSRIERELQRRTGDDQ
jgi:TetR/AcrR family transcriptional regulator, fatty acid metabolism regulator protein